MPKIKCKNCGKVWHGWSLKYKKCYCDCGKVLNIREVKKVSRPYFETKVVKVKVEKEECWCGGMRIGDKQYKVFKRKKGVPYLKEFKKGNYVNGENLDKIKFPCFCRWQGGYGMIIHGFSDEREYILVEIEEQEKDVCTVNRSNSLGRLIELNDIHILKGKIIIFEEEK